MPFWSLWESLSLYTRHFVFGKQYLTCKLLSQSSNIFWNIKAFHPSDFSRHLMHLKVFYDPHYICVLLIQILHQYMRAVQKKMRPELFQWIDPLCLLARRTLICDFRLYESSAPFVPSRGKNKLLLILYSDDRSSLIAVLKATILLLLGVRQQLPKSNSLFCCKMQAGFLFTSSGRKVVKCRQNFQLLASLAMHWSRLTERYALFFLSFGSSLFPVLFLDVQYFSLHAGSLSSTCWCKMRKIFFPRLFRQQLFLM